MNENYMTLYATLIRTLSAWCIGLKYMDRLNAYRIKSMIICQSRLLATIDLNNLPIITVNETPNPYNDKVNSLGLTNNNTQGQTDAVVATCNRDCNTYLLSTKKLSLIKASVFPYFNYFSAEINEMIETLNLS